MSDTKPVEPPMLLVISPEKAGKSSLATTLIDWPEPGYSPLVIAWDATGPDSCAALGYPVPAIKVGTRPGATWWERALGVLGDLERAKANGGLNNVGAIVTDCCSTMADRLFEDIRRYRPSKDPRQNYGELLEQSRNYMYRILDLNIPSIWLAWLDDPFTAETKVGNSTATKFTLGRPKILGTFKKNLAGKAHVILYLEKLKAAMNDPAADRTGYKRIIHTRTYDNVEAGGRYALPEPCPAHLGVILDLILQRGDVYAQWKASQS